VIGAGCRSRCLCDLSFHGQNIHLRGIDPAAIDAMEIQLCAEIKRGDGILKGREGDARIDQRTEKHVAANSRKTVQVADLHFADPLTGRSCGPPIVISEIGSKAFIEPER